MKKKLMALLLTFGALAFITSSFSVEKAKVNSINIENILSESANVLVNYSGSSYKRGAICYSSVDTDLEPGLPNVRTKDVTFTGGTSVEVISLNHLTPGTKYYLNFVSTEISCRGLKTTFTTKPKD